MKGDKKQRFLLNVHKMSAEYQSMSLLNSTVSRGNIIGDGDGEVWYWSVCSGPLNNLTYALCFPCTEIIYVDFKTVLIKMMIEIMILNAIQVNKVKLDQNWSYPDMNGAESLHQRP